jgi:hypothetical protein
MKRLITIGILLFFCFCLTTYTQNGPVPYAPEEFPDWTHTLRRAEIVAIGVFPIAFFVTNLSYGLIRFAIKKFNTAYAPWFFAPPDAPPLSGTEKTGLLLTSIGISLTISLVDFLLKEKETSKKTIQSMSDDQE